MKEEMEKLAKKLVGRGTKVPMTWDISFSPMSLDCSIIIKWPGWKIWQGDHVLNKLENEELWLPLGDKIDMRTIKFRRSRLRKQDECRIVISFKRRETGDALETILDWYS